MYFGSIAIKHKNVDINVYRRFLISYEERLSIAKMSLVKDLEAELSLAKERVQNIKDEIDSIRALCPHERTHKERDYDCHSARWLHICDDCGLISTQAYRAQHAAK